MGNEILCQPSKMVDNMLVYRRNVETPTPQEVRVAAYCRVSKNLFSQESSIELQMDSYRKRISEHPGWYLVGIYADRGSGTTVSGRMEFQRLIQDALDGKIDYILAKSVSRFARNTLDTLSYTRKLKDIGVGVYFEEQSLDTMGMFSEIFLTIHAAFAQEESHSLSENMKHGMRNRFALGIPKWSETYGYRRNEDEIWYVHKEEAKVVREIYRLYTEGYSISEIRTELDERRIQPPKGSRTVSGDSVWWTHSIATILHSEKYIGDLEMQKSYTVDYMTRKRVQNTNADIPKYYRKSHHERIIDDETFMITQTILMMQNRHRCGGSQYPFYGFLKCPLCGENMVRLRLPTRKYETAYTMTAIANALNELGVRGIRKHNPLHASYIGHILRNEIYVGDRLLQKSPPKHYLTHKPDRNQPYDSYYHKNMHTGIVSRELWNAVQGKLVASRHSGV